MLASEDHLSGSRKTQRASRRQPAKGLGRVRRNLHRTPGRKRLEVADSGIIAFRKPVDAGRIIDWRATTRDGEPATGRMATRCRDAVGRSSGPTSWME